MNPSPSKEIFRAPKNNLTQKEKHTHTHKWKKKIMYKYISFSSSSFLDAKKNFKLGVFFALPNNYLIERKRNMPCSLNWAPHDVEPCSLFLHKPSTLSCERTPSV